MRRLFCIAICLLASMSAFAQYGTTKQYEYRYSSKEHKLKIQVDYPKKGNPAFLRRVRSFIMEALEFDPYSGAASIGRYNGDPSDGQAVINYYGTAGVPLLKKRCAAYEWEAMEEERVIKRIAENDYYVTFEVKVLIWASSYGYNPVIDCYGETFRKSDGKKLNIIANSQSPQFKKLLNDRFPEDMKGFMYNDETDIPIPETEPYLLKDGVRFVYQMREITAPDAHYIQVDIPFPEIKQFLTKEVKDVLGQSSKNSEEMDIRTTTSKKNEVIETKVNDNVVEKPQFPGGTAAMFEYLSKNIKYPVVAEENGVQGKVIVSFIVECDGSISNVKVVKSVDPALDKEAMRIVRSMPHWIPGKRNGSAVRVKYTTPVTFRLSDKDK